ncbi:MAG: cell division protein SepF [Kutzneria sp.]|nr:cell division protein SepF [Kutzneria sp.]MBV9845126.1 cell division protein SepF [Kutzneria sp.]
MSALHKLKAYFGMVPAEDMDEYSDDDRYGSDYYSPDEDTDRDGYDRYSSPRRRPTSAGSSYRFDYDEDGYSSATDRSRARRGWATEMPTRGALAMEPKHDPVVRPRVASEVKTSSEPAAPSPAKIITLNPRSYTEARTIGEHYRDGAPVIINLTDMDNADAKRLVDFAAGLAFALRGSMDKVTNKVFLLSPPEVDVSAEDRRRIAEGGLFS